MSSIRRFSLPLVLAAFCLTDAHAQSQAILAGKTLNLTITSGAAPFATSGTQVLALDAPSVGRYTLDTNGTRSASGTYGYSTTAIGADLQLNTYFPATGGSATISLYSFNANAGSGNFETFVGTTSNSGTWVFAGNSGGGGGGGGGAAMPAGSVVGWGWNLSGQTTIPPGLTNLTGIAAGSQFSVALKSDGTLAAWGSNALGQTNLPAGLTGVTAIAAGSFHGVALKSDGSLIMWGASADGQRNNLPTSGTFTAISARLTHNLAVRSDGTVTAWGSNPAGTFNAPPAGLTGVTRVAAGVLHDLALKSDGTVVAWGNNDRGQTSVPPGLSSVVAIAAGQFHSLALRSDGVVIGWGGTRTSNTFSIPQNAVNGGVAIAAGFEHSMVLKADGTIVAWGENNFGQTVIPASAAGAKQIAAGEYFNLALVGEGTGGSGTGTPPVIATQPAPQLASVGGSVTFTVAVTGTGLSFQWLFNNSAIPGAINASYTLNGLTSANAGNYSVRITNSGGTITSNPVPLTVNPADAGITFLGNLSVRARAGSGSETLIVGVTVGGSSNTPKSVLIRGIGPTLASFGVGDVLPDPVLIVLSGTTPIATNDDWGTESDIAAISAAVGAFALPAGSRDSALFGTGIANGGYTIQLTGKAGATGNALIELYDIAPAGSITATTTRLTNLSARTFGGTGSETLIVGFSLSGNVTRRLVIRAVGPGLNAFGVTGTMSDPKLELYNGNTKVGENDNWETSTLAAQQGVGAFALTNGSRDAVLVATLGPGGYTVQVTGGTEGVVLVEAYEAP